jgi:hypothetical protein
MNRRELLETLRKEGIRDDAYNLDGGYADETLTLSEANGRWCIYYCEHGTETGKKEFATETEACGYLLNELRRHSSARLNAPSMTLQELFEILRKERIREVRGRWFVSWTDPLMESKETECATEAEACEYLWTKMTNNPATQE